MPGRLLDKLKDISKSSDRTLEETILELLCEHLSISDQEVKIQLHLKLYEKYLRDARDLLEKKDYVHVGEKLWGASAQIVKVVVAKRETTLDTHADLWDFVAKLRVELEDPEIGRLWSSANVLHRNFYEAHAPPELIQDYAHDVNKFLEKLKKLI